MVIGRVVLVAAIFAPHLAAADRIKVAVVPGISVNVASARVDALTGALAYALANKLDVDARGGLDVRRQLPTEGLPPDCVTTPSCTADVARRTGATQLLFVVMVDIGAVGSIRIETTWIEPSTGRLASRPAIELTSTADAEANATFATIAHGLLPDAPMHPGPKAEPSVTTTRTLGTPRHLGTPVLITGGVAAVALGFGAVTGLVARSKYNACVRDPSCIESDPRRGTLRSFNRITDTSLVIATGTAIAALVLYVTSGTSGHVVVTPTAEGVALAAVGRF
ncbi:MAG: hypothetical protein ABI867_05870 [Kofleriaceae bacterium]